MKILTLIVILFTSAYSVELRPRAIAKLCGNLVIKARPLFIRSAVKQIEREGCSEIRTVDLDDDYILIYGIKVDIGESNNRTIRSTMGAAEAGGGGSYSR